VVTVEFLTRTRRWSVAATVLLCLWLFGNLYEEVVWIPQLIADPRPGTLVGALALGSPVYYYLPWAPVSLVLTVVLRVRFGPAAPPRVRRAWTAAIAALVVAVLGKIGLITLVNPVFRDPAAAPEVVHDRAVLWAVGNGVVLVAVAIALVLLTAWRRP
jgi:F0F1-type ATP synthase membrane subunit c/vacuolar-type H+-ATPase subunit K